MSKPIYKVVTDHVLINNQVQNLITLDSLVIGIQIRVYTTSSVGLLYGLNENPKIPLSSTDLPASYGGFSVDGVPCIYEGDINIRWNSNTQGQGLVVITRLVPQPIEGQEICN